ncbi:unnamed protein product [Soboliphyme baturini]|uniref:Transmembrane protein n=1 Tax=Soboliphyme baturini TaxID=241478 RepID=A0A183J7K1_9BILA|nr:unnamed protein product [Soboliphyme baturini]
MASNERCVSQSLKTPKKQTAESSVKGAPFPEQFLVRVVDSSIVIVIIVVVHCCTVRC